jgi:hypothetical protein
MKGKRRTEPIIIQLIVTSLTVHQNDWERLGKGGDAPNCSSIQWTLKMPYGRPIKSTTSTKPFFHGQSMRLTRVWSHIEDSEEVNTSHL